MDELEFKNHLKVYLTEEEITSLWNAINTPEDSLSSIVIDTDKISQKLLLETYPTLIPHPIVPNVYLFNKNELDLGKSLLFEIGAFYIFEPCSSLVSYFLNPQEDDLILDMAAAPGGKTIHTSFLMHNHGQIIANEISKSRAEILSSNVEKYGRKNVTVISSDCEKISRRFPNTFTKIILDAPCSGSGMFRKETKMKDDWTLNKVLSLNPLQQELILEAYSMLTPGGEMIYSTCSFSYEEDEAIINYLLANSDAELIDLPHIDGEYRSNLKETIHLFPHLFKGEGHFIAKIKKPGLKPINAFPSYKSNVKKVPNFLLNKGDLFQANDDLYLTNHVLDLKNFHVLRNGIKIGKIDSKLGIIYDHAISRLQEELLPTVEIDDIQAKSFIFGNQVNQKSDNGYMILSYKGIKFALGKATNGQIKNHYPKGLRKKL